MCVRLQVHILGIWYPSRYVLPLPLLLTYTLGRTKKDGKCRRHEGRAPDTVASQMNQRTLAQHRIHRGEVDGGWQAPHEVLRVELVVVS